MGVVLYKNQKRGSVIHSGGLLWNRGISIHIRRYPGLNVYTEYSKD